MKDQKIDNIENSHDLVYRKCLEVFVFLGIIAVIVLVMMFGFLSSKTMSTSEKGSVAEFFLLVEFIILILVFEAYVNTLTISQDGITIESGIILKHKTKIPYNKINTVNTHSIFGLGVLEIFTGNDVVIRYKYLERYEEVEGLINEHIKGDKKEDE